MLPWRARFGGYRACSDYRAGGDVPALCWWGTSLCRGRVQDEDVWSPLSVCEAYAEKRGYRIARVGRPDPHRGGREIIQHCADGVICLAFLPPKE